MTIFRNIKDGELYCLFKVSPPKVTGSWIEAENFFTKEKRKLNNSSFKQEDFIAIAHR